MSLSYVVTTGNHLPKTKEIFGCYCEAIKHLKSVIDRAENALKKREITFDQVHLSYSVVRLEKSKFPEYTKIFLNAIERAKTQLKKSA